jgi:hypothetical protein
MSISGFRARINFSRSILSDGARLLGETWVAAVGACWNSEENPATLPTKNTVNKKIECRYLFLINTNIIKTILLNII